MPKRCTLSSGRLLLCASTVMVALVLFGPTANRAETPPNPAEVLGTEIDSLRALGRYSDASEHARELLALRKGEPKTKPYRLVDADWLVRTMDLAVALPDSVRAELAWADSVNSANLRIKDLMARGLYSEGISILQRQIEVRRRILGEEHPDVARSLNDLAVLLMDKGDYAGAEPLYRESLAMQRKVLGEEHPDVATSLGNVADLLQAKGDCAAAEPLLREALAMQRKLLGEEHWDVAASLNNLGGLLWERGDYAGAEPFLREALALLRKLLGEEHADVATSLNNLAVFLAAKGDYAAADPLLREALAIERKLLGEDHPDVALSLNNLGMLLQDKGDYAGAEPLQREALAMQRKLLGEEHPDVALSLNNLAALLQSKGEYAGAEPLQREALAMQRKLLGEEHPDVALSLNNLGLLLADKGDYAGAEPLYRESLAMWRKLLGEEHPDVAKSLNNLAALLQSKGDYAGAEPLYRQSLAMWRNLLGEEHANVAVSLDNLGMLLQDKGDYAGAEPLQREALAMQRKLLGEEHPDVAMSLYNLGDLLRAKGDLAGAEAILLQASAVYDAARLRVGSDIERSTFQSSPYPSLAEAHLERGHAADAWPAAERGLGRSLFDLLTMANQRLLSPTEAVREDSLRWLLGGLERQLEAYCNAARRDTTGQMAKEVEEIRTRLIETEAVWSTFRQEMATEYPVTEGQAYPLERVQVALDSTTALVGWLDVEIRKNDVSRWGYVIRRDGPVTWEGVSPSAGKDGKDRSRADHAPPSRATLFRNAVTDSSPLARGNGVDNVAGVPLAIKSEARGRALFAERLAPLLSHLNGVRNLVVIPSGEMLGVPVEALPLDDGRPLGEGFEVSYTPSATIYTWLREKDRGRRGWDESTAILLLGDPPFSDAQKNQMEKEKDKSREIAKNTETRKEEPRPSSLALASIPDAPDSLLQRSAVSGNFDALERLPRLPATRQEVEDVSKLSRHPTVLLGLDASEQRLVAMARSGELGKYRLIHFATHAWVNPERPEESSLFLSRVDLPDRLEAAEKGDRTYDSRLTVKEILQEWKLDADLVTLSGCQTALGQRFTGEGYVGFAHAFLQAGARSLLLSLWPVEDQATSLLMQRFYGHLFGKARDDRGAKRDERPMTKGVRSRRRNGGSGSTGTRTGFSPIRSPTTGPRSCLVVPDHPGHRFRSNPAAVPG
jgi:CHAT domain-containing protein/Tfp pilus assembly protein PilF